MEKRVFSGVQPTGNLHIGNYLGAVKQWVKSQSEGLNIYCIVDLHAITIPLEPSILKEKVKATAALLLASGIDPDKSIFFVQSTNPDHANLAWIVNCFLSMGQLNRMTQYKGKSEGKDFVSVGLFDYPALMAADILLYDTTEVPVGEDQVQHVELTRDVAERFNSRMGDTFTLPKPVLPKSGARIMSLTDPTKKMSKSDPDPNSRINLLDNEEEIFSKILSATTDSDKEITYNREAKPGISNLLEIYTSFNGKDIKEAEKYFSGKGYGEFKKEVAQEVSNQLSPLREEYNEFVENSKLLDILQRGSQKAVAISSKKMIEVKEKMGFEV